MKGAVSGSCNAGKCTYDSPLAVASCDPGKKKEYWGPSTYYVSTVLNVF